MNLKVENGEMTGRAQPHSIYFWGIFPHYNGDLKMTNLTIKRPIYSSKQPI